MAMVHEFAIDQQRFDAVSQRSGARAYVQLYLEQMTQALQVLHAQCHAADASEWRAIAHRMKGSSATLGLESARILFEQIEKQCQAGHADKERMLEQLQHEKELIERHFNTVLDET